MKVLAGHPHGDQHTLFSRSEGAPDGDGVLIQHQQVEHVGHKWVLVTYGPGALFLAVFGYP